jgi:hypothetical protein
MTHRSIWIRKTGFGVIFSGGPMKAGQWQEYDFLGDAKSRNTLMAARPKSKREVEDAGFEVNDNERTIAPL